MKVACIWFSDQAQDKGSVQKVAELCLRFSPQICVRSTEAVFIEIGKCRKLYTEAGFHARVLVILRRLGLEANVAFGTDITEALLRAQNKTQDLGQLQLSALLEFADPFNKDPIARQYVNKMIVAFQDLGVKNIAGFKLIPTADLISRFGAIAVLCKQRVNFEVPIVWVYWKPLEVIAEKMEFPYFEFYGELEPILFELKKQLDILFQRLWARSLKAQSMQVKIFCETNSQNPKAFRQFDFNFLFAQSSAKACLKIIKERLTRDFEKRRILSPIEGLETTVTATVPGAIGQRNLLHRHDEIHEQQQALIEQLTEVHGKNNIFFAELLPDRRPEKSWKKSETARLANSDFIDRIPLRPSHLIQPEIIEISSGFVHIRKKTYQILNWSSLSAEAERITGGWQEQTKDLNNSYDRNYFILELENGSSISVFQTPDQTFYLQGYFG